MTSARCCHPERRRGIGVGGRFGNVAIRTSRPHRFLPFALLRVGMTLLLASAAFADNSATPPKLPGEVSIQQNLNAQLPLDLMFRDESGRIVRLRELYRGKPVLLN